MLVRDQAYLVDMYLAATQVDTYLHGISEESFLQDVMRQDAVIRQMIVLGEAVTCLSKELRQQQAHIDWREIAGFRNVLVHAYRKINLKEVWRIGTHSVPKLLCNLRLISGVDLIELDS